MPFIENHARLLRFLGSPFTPFYYGVTSLRNFLYDKGYIASRTFPFPVICVGNLCAGGSGKTPMTEYLLRFLLPSYHIGVVSRGYGRRSRNDFMAEPGMDASTVGDEPMQYLRNFSRPDCDTNLDCDAKSSSFALYLSARRARGIEALKTLRPDLDAVILDDAFQHRSVKAGLNLLLSDFSQPFFRDHLLPYGTLRESRRGCKRAGMIIFTKCPPFLDQDTAALYIRACERYFPGSGHAGFPHPIEVYFTTLDYADVQVVGQGCDKDALYPGRKIVLFTGIANPDPMERYVRSKGCEVLKHFRFGDHHEYSPDDLRQISSAVQQAGTGGASDVLLLTTEKDYSRLLSPLTFDYLCRRWDAVRQCNPCKPDSTALAFRYLCQLPLAYLPVRPRFLFQQETRFEERIRGFIDGFPSACGAM